VQKILLLIAVLAASSAAAQDKAFSLQVPQPLAEGGLLDYALPRFSLKTGIRITVTDMTADAILGKTGTPVFRRGEVVWHFDARGDADAASFEEWLLSDIGKRTVESFESATGQTFIADVGKAVVVEKTEVTGDAIWGEEVSLRKCGRCHVINQKNRMKAIGSTPSFALMRGFPDWLERFEAFYILKPHGAFTQVTDVTEPFADHLPSPISPIEVTLTEIEAITAYVGSISPADLGAPLQAGRVFQSP